jgi:anti-sigma regulatory factor (Ser/Thr protein kinase)
VDEWRLPARRSELSTARERAQEAAVAFGLDAEACYEFVFAVNEAVTNAIKHGTADEQGRIGLRFTTDGDRLICVVQDEGTFVVPAEDPKPAREHGRGFRLMAKLVDALELSIRPGSTTIRLSKERPLPKLSAVADDAGATA